MTTPTPEQARFFLENLALPWLKNEHPLTKRIIEAVPVDKGDYRPDQISKTAFELAWHIAVAENRFLDAVASGEFRYDQSRPDWVHNSADVSKWYSENFDANIRRIEKLSDDPVIEDCRLQRNPAMACRPIFTERAPSFDPSSRAVVAVSPADGREGPIHLRHELRRRPSNGKKVGSFRLGTKVVCTAPTGLIHFATVTPFLRAGLGLFRRYAADSAREASDTTLAHSVSCGSKNLIAISPVGAVQMTFCAKPHTPSPTTATSTAQPLFADTWSKALQARPASPR